MLGLGSVERLSCSFAFLSVLSSVGAKSRLPQVQEVSEWRPIRWLTVKLKASAWRSSLHVCPNSRLFGFYPYLRFLELSIVFENVLKPGWWGRYHGNYSGVHRPVRWESSMNLIRCAWARAVSTVSWAHEDYSGELKKKGNDWFIFFKDLI